MAWIVALDVGTVRVGCAVADDGVRIPFPVAVWPRAQGEAERHLLALLNERNAATLVVGLPLDQNGKPTPTCASIEAFARRIARRRQVSLHFVDESFSSLDAAERLNDAGHTRNHVDAHAACLILERYFEEQ